MGPYWVKDSLEKACLQIIDKNNEGVKLDWHKAVLYDQKRSILPQTHNTKRNTQDKR